MVDWPKDFQGRNIPMGKLPKETRYALAREACERLEPFLRSPEMAAFIRMEVGFVQLEPMRVGVKRMTELPPGSFPKLHETLPPPMNRALAILTQLKRKYGRAYKINIRQAWETGNYSTFPELAYELQWMRNNLGPKWLNQHTGASK